jgi:hypothetical protein
VSVLVRAPSTTRGYFLEVSLTVIGSPVGSPCSPPGFLLADFPTSLPHGETDVSNCPHASASFVTPSSLSTAAQEYLTCFPSPTLFSLGLGSGLPREDELDPGILRFSARKIFTSFIVYSCHAFSLVCAPMLLTVHLLRTYYALLPRSPCGEHP